jgi:hypothetical protein
MSMGSTSPPVATWFKDLPLTDPRCKNDSCTAYYNAHIESQAQISWASQFLYGHYVSWYYAIVIFAFAALHQVRRIRDANPHATGSEVGILDQSKARLRSLSYRRLSGPLGCYLELPSLGVIILLAFFLFSSLVMALVQHPYYRGSRGYGSPPVAVRTGLMAAALYPLTVALAGKVLVVAQLLLSTKSSSHFRSTSLRC